MRVDWLGFLGKDIIRSVATERRLLSGLLAYHIYENNSSTLLGISNLCVTTRLLPLRWLQSTQLGMHEGGVNLTRSVTYLSIAGSEIKKKREVQTGVKSVICQSSRGSRCHWWWIEIPPPSAFILVSLCFSWGPVWVLSVYLIMPPSPSISDDNNSHFVSARHLHLGLWLWDIFYSI